MPVELISLCRVRGVRAAKVKRTARRLLRTLAVEDELSIALVSDAAMQRLNARYRDNNHPTDVLAFPMDEGKTGSGLPALLGDVVISLETAKRQASERNIGVAEEVRALLVHGVLHLLGYDHERSSTEARRMRAREKKLLAILNAEG